MKNKKEIKLYMLNRGKRQKKENLGNRELKEVNACINVRIEIIRNSKVKITHVLKQKNIIMEN